MDFVVGMRAAAQRRLAGRLGALVATALVLGGCSLWGRGGDEPETTAATARERPGEAEPIDVRRYIGPNYCPELRVIKGAELLRQYQGDSEESSNLVWQASIGRTARECLYDQQGGLTLKIGISGRAISGPKGGAATVSVPLKVAVVKHKEATLATESSKIEAAIPAAGSAVFSEVRNILVPSPGRDRDYIIYVGFDAAEWDLMTGEVVEKVAVVKPKAPPPPPPPKAVAPAAPSTPNVLPTPSGGFVLPQ